MITKPGLNLPQTSHLGQITLAVADLKLEQDFYTRVIGMEVLKSSGSTISLGVPGSELLRLIHKPGSKHYEGRAGLYHFCLLTPERRELGLLLKRLNSAQTQLQGMVDHHVAEAIYLSDPEGNGIELNWDRPRTEWPASMGEMMRMGNSPLDVESLLELADAGPAGSGLLPKDASLSHIHLHVADVEASRRFYHGLLGLDITGEFRGQAVFTSAGGYHHHIAFNIWNGRGAAKQPEDAGGLVWFSFIIPEAQALQEAVARIEAAGFRALDLPEGRLFQDPAGNGLLLA